MRFPSPHAPAARDRQRAAGRALGGLAVAVTLIGCESPHATVDRAMEAETVRPAAAAQPAPEPAAPAASAPRALRLPSSLQSYGL